MSHSRMDAALALEDDVRAALAAEFGPVAERYDGPLDRAEGEAPDRQPVRVQRLGCLYPIAAGDDLEWRCVDCGEPFERGFGCVDCVEPTCGTCVAKELHLCPGDAPPTLDAIGVQLTNLETGVLGVSSEVVRSIERSAIERLRRNSIMYGLWRPSAPAGPLDRYQLSLFEQGVAARSEEASARDARRFEQRAERARATCPGCRKCLRRCRGEPGLERLKLVHDAARGERVWRWVREPHAGVPPAGPASGEIS